MQKTTDKTVNVYRKGKYMGNFIIDADAWRFMNEEQRDDEINKFLMSCGKEGAKYVSDTWKRYMNYI